MSDSNMDTLYHWAFDYSISDSLPSELENDRQN
jgi:hypothetical protein